MKAGYCKGCDEKLVCLVDCPGCGKEIAYCPYCEHVEFTRTWKND